MNEIIRAVSLAGLLAGLSWVIQTAGLGHGGLLSFSPRFFFLGAAMAGACTGAIVWTRTTFRAADVQVARI